MEIKSMAKIKYSYDLDGISLQALSQSNIVKTEVRKFNLLLKKLSNQEFFQPNDIITYTLIVSNTGNYKNTNVIIRDFLSQQKLIDYSIKTFSLSDNLTNVNYTLENDFLNIMIDEISPNDVFIITYKIQAISDISHIKQFTTIKSDETNQKEVNNDALKQGFAQIECIKSVSDDVTFLNTDLTYLLKLSNKGNISAYNVEIFDELPITFELDQYNAVTLNNTPIDYQLEGNILKLIVPTIEPNNSFDIKINGKIIN